ncbi:MAG: hypothetical protein L0H63_01050 [Nitrococcus sp.]|nr:hypothetical protein [Nitrococcus sp.]
MIERQRFPSFGADAQGFAVDDVGAIVGWQIGQQLECQHVASVGTLVAKHAVVEQVVGDAAGISY